MSGWGFVVLDRPAPQGSKRAYRRSNGTVGVEESSIRTLKPRREAIKAAAPAGPRLGDDVPVAMRIVFTLTRPSSARRTDVIPYRKPDLDKLLRALLDPIVAVGALADDARVAEFTRLAKVWPGCDDESLHVSGAVVACVDVAGPEWRDELQHHFLAALEASRPRAVTG